MTRAIAVLLITVAPVLPVQAATVRVDVDGGGDHTTIQAGLDAAAGCDTVLVAPGIYTGDDNRNLSFGYKNLVLMSEEGLGNTIIDCEGQDRAIYLYSTGQDTTTVIRGFWIRNGYTDNYNGAGLMFYGVGAVVEDCLISDCVASHNGGGLSIQYSRVPVKVRNCVFERNAAAFRGGGAIVDHASAAIRRCLFQDNSTTDFSHDSNGGGALHLNSIDYYSDVCYVSRCTFANNSSTGNGTGVHAEDSANWGSITQSVITFNRGASFGFYSDPMFENLTFSNIYGNEGGDVEPGYSTLVDGDPLFCDMAGGSFNLCSNSPCLPENNTYTVLIGFGAEGCPDCSSAVEETSWGRVKALYR